MGSVTILVSSHCAIQHAHYRLSELRNIALLDACFLSLKRGCSHLLWAVNWWELKKKTTFIFLAEKGLSCVVWGLCCSAWTLVWAHGLSCSVAHEVLVPRPGIEPPSPALQGRFLTTGPPGKSWWDVFWRVFGVWLFCVECLLHVSELWVLLTPWLSEIWFQSPARH